MNQLQKKNINKMKKISFAFFGTPDIASKTLDILLESGYIPKIIITSPDAKSGRGMHLSPTCLSIWATEHNIPCLKPEKINTTFLEEFKKFNVELSIVIAYGKILPETLIKKPKLGTINIHYSLLPLYRGASPLEQALLYGDTRTGVTIQQMKFRLDSGDIIAQKEIRVDINETKEILRENLINIGGKLLSEILPNIINGSIKNKPQDESLATYCTKIKKEDGQIDPNCNDIENYNKYRAFFGWPGVYFFIQRYDKNIRIKITKAKYENNSFIIERVVPEGKKEISYKEFLKSNISK